VLRNAERSSGNLRQQQGTIYFLTTSFSIFSLVSTAVRPFFRTVEQCGRSETRAWPGLAMGTTVPTAISVLPGNSESLNPNSKMGAVQVINDNILPTLLLIPAH
jgi:hypothetical protein